MKVVQWSVLIIAAFYLCSCSGSRNQSIRTQAISQYSFTSGKTMEIKKSDLSISMEIIRTSEIYSYPELFSFEDRDLRAKFPNYKSGMFMGQMYPKGPGGYQWENPFMAPDGNRQLMIARVKLTNHTNHILRMKDARIYLIIDGMEPIEAIGSYRDLLQTVNYFQAETNNYLKSKDSFISLSIPDHLYECILESHRDSYKLITEIGKELLPKFSIQGLLVFPAVPIKNPKAQISFYDVTVKTDNAGNALEKAQFDFPLNTELITLYYDNAANKWVPQSPVYETKK